MTVADHETYTGQDNGRPSMKRWFGAGCLAWLSVPVGSVAPWAFLVQGGPEGFFLGLFYGVLVGLPLSLPVVMILSVIVWFMYPKLADKPKWMWALFGAGLGALAALALIVVPSLPETMTADRTSGDMLNIITLSCVTCGALAGWVFRWILLRPQHRAS